MTFSVTGPALEALKTIAEVEGTDIFSALALSISTRERISDIKAKDGRMFVNYGRYYDDSEFLL